jgi:hypothetical protein
MRVCRPSWAPSPSAIWSRAHWDPRVWTRFYNLRMFTTPTIGLQHH